MYLYDFVDAPVQETTAGLLEEVIQNDLNILSKLSEVNKMNLSKGKCKSISG